jgi:hypothetical protein
MKNNLYKVLKQYEVIREWDGKLVPIEINEKLNADISLSGNVRRYV